MRHFIAAAFLVLTACSQEQIEIDPSITRSDNPEIYQLEQDYPRLRAYALAWRFVAVGRHLMQEEGEFRLAETMTRYAIAEMEGLPSNLQDPRAINLASSMADLLASGKSPKQFGVPKKDPTVEELLRALKDPKSTQNETKFNHYIGLFVKFESQLRDHHLGPTLTPRIVSRSECLATAASVTDFSLRQTIAWTSSKNALDKYFAITGHDARNTLVEKCQFKTQYVPTYLIDLTDLNWPETTTKIRNGLGLVVLDQFRRPIEPSPISVSELENERSSQFQAFQSLLESVSNEPDTLIKNSISEMIRQDKIASFIQEQLVEELQKATVLSDAQNLELWTLFQAAPDQLKGNLFFYFVRNANYVNFTKGNLYKKESDRGFRPPTTLIGDDPNEIAFWQYLESLGWAKKLETSELAKKILPSAQLWTMHPDRVVDAAAWYLKINETVIEAQ